MIVKVTSRGVTIPRRLLGEAKEAEVREEAGRIVIVPVSTKPGVESLYELGSDPVDFGVRDASVNHDRYLYEEYGGFRHSLTLVISLLLSISPEYTIAFVSRGRRNVSRTPAPP